MKSAMRAASYLEEGPLMWILHLHLHVNKKFNDNNDVACKDYKYLAISHRNWILYLLVSDFQQRIKKKEKIMRMNYGVLCL